MDPSEQAISRWLLSHSKLCTSCKGIPVDVDEVGRHESSVRTNVHHATMSDLESAANEGCRICKPMWERWLEGLVSMQHAQSPPAFCEKRLQRYRPKDYKLMLVITTIDNQPIPHVAQEYHVRPIRGKLLFPTVAPVLSWCRGK